MLYKFRQYFTSVFLRQVVCLHLIECYKKIYISNWELLISMAAKGLKNDLSSVFMFIQTLVNFFFKIRFMTSYEIKFDNYP